MEKQGDGFHRLVLVPYPLQGHVTPLLQLDTILHSRGFSITVAHTKSYSPDTPSDTFMRVCPVYNAKNKDVFLQIVAGAHNLDTSSAIVFNSSDCLERPSLAQLRQIYKVPIFPIGPLHKLAPPASFSTTSSLIEEDKSCIAWLDKQTENSVIYVSLGSTASLDEKELTEMAWGLANSKQPFLWVLRPGSVHGSEAIALFSNDFKENIGERGYIVKWAPQKQVLAHKAVGGFWSHCGWNSTIESISEGVPMICRPFFGDQNINTRYTSHVWRVGIELENDLEREEIERAIRRLMVENEGEEMRQRAADLKLQLEISIQKGGSSYDSLNELIELIMPV